MTTLQLVVFLLCLAFFVGVTRQVHSGRMLLRYALLWMFLSVVAMICALFPGGVFALSEVLGFETPSNFVLFIGLFAVLVICLSLSIIVSGQAQKIKSLVQELAILEYRTKEDGEFDSSRKR